MPVPGSAGLTRPRKKKQPEHENIRVPAVAAEVISPVVAEAKILVFLEVCKMFLRGGGSFVGPASCFKRVEWTPVTRYTQTDGCGFQQQFTRGFLLFSLCPFWCVLFRLGP